MSASEIQKLRELTSAGVMDCKKALSEANGNFDTALKIIRDKGLASVEKRADRKTGAGLVHSYVHGERVGVILELRSETDFVAHSDPFRVLIHDIAMHIAAMMPDNSEELLIQPFVKDPSRTVKELIGELTAKVGEKIEIGKFYRIEV